MNKDASRYTQKGDRDRPASAFSASVGLIYRKKQFEALPCATVLFLFDALPAIFLQLAHLSLNLAPSPILWPPAISDLPHPS